MEADTRASLFTKVSRFQNAVPAFIFPAESQQIPYYCWQEVALQSGGKLWAYLTARHPHGRNPGFHCKWPLFREFPAETCAPLTARTSTHISILKSLVFVSQRLAQSAPFVTVRRAQRRWVPSATAVILALGLWSEIPAHGFAFVLGAFELIRAASVRLSTHCGHFIRPRAAGRSASACPSRSTTSWPRRSAASSM